jgi:hypothetical protein
VQRAARRIERRRQLARHRHRLAGALHDGVAHRMFMFRIAHREGRGHGKRIDLVRDRRESVCQGLQVQWLRHRAIVVMPAGDGDHLHTGKRRRNAGAFDHARIKPHQHHGHCTAMAFDHRICGQRGGN